MRKVANWLIKAYDILVRWVGKEQIFPLLLIIFSVLMITLSLSGWSIGKLYNYFSAPNSVDDPTLITGQPQDVRSDEWLVITPKSIASVKNGLNVVNNNIGYGEDEAILIDAPTKDFTALFQPQNFGFFIMHIGNALAFKWWFLIIGLLISSYYFVLHFFTKKIKIAIAISLFVLFTPLVMWTFRSILVIPLIMGLTSVILADKMRQRRFKANLWNIMALTYVLFSFILVLYPPFQISIAIILGFFYIFYVLNQRISFKKMINIHISMFVSIALVLGLTSVFYEEHKAVFTAVIGAKHPGVRHFQTGQINNLPELADFWLSGSTRVLQNQSTSEQINYYQVTSNGNQMEAASTMWLLPPLIVTLSLFIYERWRNKQKIILLAGVVALEVLVALFYFVPGLEIPIISQIQPNRANVMLLLINIISFGLIVKYQQKGKYIFKDRRLVAILVATWVVYVAAMVLALYKIRVNFPNVISQEATLIALVVTVLGAYWFIKNKPSYAIAIFAALTIFTTYDTNPVYKGVNSIMDTPIIKEINRINKLDPGVWFFDGSIILESAPLLSGVQTITTNYSYEQNFWHYLDPVGNYTAVYNRAAHTVGDITPKTSLNLDAVNVIRINLNPCDNKLVKELNLKYVVSVNSVNFSNYLSPCLTKIEQVPTRLDPLTTIYKISQNKIDEK